MRSFLKLGCLEARSLLWPVKWRRFFAKIGFCMAGFPANTAPEVPRMITYTKQPHAREYRLIFKNMDREGWDPSIAEFSLEPLVGIEPTTYSLRMNCSTPELQRRLVGRNARKQSCPQPASGKSLRMGESAEINRAFLGNISRWRR